ncbi:hypothetical protein [Nitrospira lenta]|uniref:Uncharacterized protein n=1 Tax=Nitrospira lenta TaxID=1436998 RepID=A0A330L2T2_9BACT|nr:hypothetical protein [Nitrospira lenta]SPP64078.1 exported hypothetical protein [Nitrospira lenta]
MAFLRVMSIAACVLILCASVTVSITGTALATDSPGILVRSALITPTALPATFQMFFE